MNETRFLLLKALVCGTLLSAAGGCSKSSGELTPFVQRLGPTGATTIRASLDNVSRPILAAGTCSSTELPAATNVAVGFELGWFDPGRSRPAVRAVEWHAEDGAVVAFQPPVGKAESGWLRVRGEVEKLPPAVWEIRVNGAVAGNGSGWRSSVPRVQSADPRQRPDVLVITVDTLRADYLSCYGHDRNTSPNLDAFAAESVLFERAIAQSSWTLPSYVSMLTSLYNERHGVVHTHHQFAEFFTSLAELYQQAGYRTGAVVSGTFTDAYWGMDQGFDDYDDLGMVTDDREPSPEDPTDISRMEQRAHRRVTSEEVSAKATDWLAQCGGQPFFFLAHYFDPHNDYVFHPGISEKFPPRSEQRFSDRDQNKEVTARLRALYEGEIHYTDQAIGRLLDTLRSMGRNDNTIVVICADHGEELFDRFQFGHAHSMFKELVHVPLMFRVPDVAPKRVPATVGNVDIAPTLLELCGLKIPPEYQGRSLEALLRGDGESRGAPVFSSLYPSFPEHPGERADLWAFRVDQDEGSVLADDRLAGKKRFHFDWEADPRELEDQDDRRFKQQAVESFRAARERMTARQPPPSTLDLDDGTLEVLRELGYAGGGSGKD